MSTSLSKSIQSNFHSIIPKCHRCGRPKFGIQLVTQVNGNNIELQTKSKAGLCICSNVRMHKKRRYLYRRGIRI